MSAFADRLKKVTEEAQKPRISDFETWFEAQDETDKRALLDAAAAAVLSIRELHDFVRAEDPDRPDWVPAKVGRERFTDWLYANGYPKKR